MTDKIQLAWLHGSKQAGIENLNARQSSQSNSLGNIVGPFARTFGDPAVSAGKTLIRRQGPDMITRPRTTGAVSAPVTSR